MIGAQLPDEEILGKAYDARLMMRILRYLRPYWKLLAVAFSFLLLQTGTQLLGPYITKIAIDRYIATRDIHGLDLMALAYLGVVVCGFVVLFIQTYTTEYIGQRAMHDLRLEIFSHLQKQDLAYFDRNAVGRLMTRTINDVETLNELFSTGVVGLMGDVSIVFGIAAVMLWLDWQLALVCLAAFPVIRLFQPLLSPARPRGLSPEPADPRPAQCRLAGKHRRRGDGAGVRPRRADVPALSRGQSQLSRCLAAEHSQQRGVLSDDRTVQRDLGRTCCSGTAASRCSATPSKPACWWRFSSTFSACTNRSATWRKSTISCRPPWPRRNGFFSCSMRPKPSRIRLSPSASTGSPARSNSKTSSCLTSRAIRC